MHSVSMVGNMSKLHRNHNNLNWIDFLAIDSSNAHFCRNATEVSHEESSSNNNKEIKEDTYPSEDTSLIREVGNLSFNYFQSFSSEII